MTGRTAYCPASVWDALRFRVQHDGARAAIVGADGTGIDFAELGLRSARRAAAMQARLGDVARVALVFDRHEWLDFAVTYLGALGAGMVPVLLENHRDRLVPRLREVRAEVVVIGPSVERQEAGWFRCTDLDDGPDVDADVMRAGQRTCVPADGPLDAMYTSGTVGGSYIPVEYAVSDWLDGVRMRPVRREVASVHALFPPHSSAGAHGLLLGHLFRGVCSVASSTRDVHDLHGEALALVAAIERHRPSEVVLTPGLVATLSAGHLLDPDVFASVMTVKFGGAPLSPMHGADLMAALPHVRILSMYGTTESARALLLAPWRPERPDVISRAGEHVRVVGPANTPVEPGQEGEIQVRAAGEILRTRYAGTAIPVAGGWTPTGDIGRIEDGWVHLVGRSKEVLVLASGARANASNIERRIMHTPAVVAAKVVGLPQAGATWDVVAAALVLAPGAGQPDVISAYESLRPEETPARTLIVDELPRNGMSKIAVSGVRSMLATVVAGVHDHRAGAGSTALGGAR